MTRQISQDELARLLADDDTAEAALRDYFREVQVNAFSFKIALQEDVAVAYGPQEGGLFDILGAANRWRRRERRIAYHRRKAEQPDLPLAVSEGDSWFQHPLIADVIDHLGSSFNIYSLGAAGAELRDILDEDEYPRALSLDGARVFFLSGGGNDMMGDRFGDFLTDPAPPPGSPPDQFLNPACSIEIDALMGIYSTIMSRVAASHPHVTIVTHGYDYVIPRPAGDGGKWLGKPMERVGISLQEDRNAVIRHLIQILNTRLETLAAVRPNVVHANSCGLVQPDEWDDEIHPTSDGFLKVANNIREKALGILA